MARVLHRLLQRSARTFVTVASFALFLLAFHRVARAQTARPAAAPAPSLVAPKATSLPRVPYPQGGAGDAVVVVELLVDAYGDVATVKIVDGGEPFAGAALAAAADWRFTPARRGEVSVAAKIRVRVEFTAPKPLVVYPDGGVIESAKDGGAAAPLADGGAANTGAAGTGGGASVLEQVEVTGVRKEAGQITLGGGEVRQIPGAFGDAFRAMEAMPGVTPILSGLPFFYVRGAPPGNTGYYLDGVRVPLLFHLGLGPSVVHPGLIDHVDFYPGAFPARFGRYTGGILSGETRQPAVELHGEGNVRFIDAGLLVETPIGPNVTVLAAGRYSYTAALLTLAAAITGNKVRLDYWDYQTRVAYRITRDDTLSLFAFGSFDYLGAESDGKFQDIFSTQFHRLDLRWDHKMQDGQMRLATTVGYDLTGAASTVAVHDTVVGARFDLLKKLSSELTFRAGSDVWLDVYAVSALGDNNNNSSTNTAPPPSGADPGASPPPDASGPSGSSASSSPSSSSGNGLIPPRRDLAMGVWFDFIYKPHPRVEIVPGARFDYFGSAQDTSAVSAATGNVLFAGGGAGVPSFDPRLATRIRIHPKVTSIEQVAITHQPPSFIVPVPGLALGSLRTGLQSAYTLSQGFEIELPAAFTFTPTVFNQDYLGLTDLITSCQGSNVAGNCVDERVRGRTYGLEVLLRRSLTKRFTGWLAYTLSRTTRSTNAPRDIIDLSKIPAGTTDLGAAVNAAQGRGSTGTILGEYDRTHVLNIIGALDLGAGFRFGTRFVYYTGTPYSQQIADIPIPPYNNTRLPDFFRFDARLEKKWNLKRGAWVALVFEWMNVTLQKEAIRAECRYPADQRLQLKQTCTPTLIGPVTIPSIGLEGAL